MISASASLSFDILRYQGADLVVRFDTSRTV